MGILCRVFYSLVLFIFVTIWISFEPDQINEFHSQFGATHLSTRRFNYILEPGDDVCSIGRSLLLMVYVHSAIENYYRREAIRLTWGSHSTFGKHLRILFMLGSSESPEIMKKIQFEFDTYGDIVQQSFIDNYRNLTYKGIMALDWISQHCKHALYILKTDDDMLLNMFSILNHLYTVTYVYPQEAWHFTIACLIWRRMHVSRDPSSKWFVSSREYPYKYYKPYCSGSAYFLTHDLILPLHEAVNNAPFFWIDDYYFTGILPTFISPSSIHINYLYLNSIFVVNTDLVEKRFLSPFGLSSLAFAHMPSSLNRFVYIWKNLLLTSHSAHKYFNLTDD